MAIGDAWTAFLGTAATNRQPSSGVEEQVSGAGRNGTTDILDMYDGTNIVNLYAADVAPGTLAGVGKGFNNGIMITNSIYLRKQGTSDTAYAGGVQTNA